MAALQMRIAAQNGQSSLSSVVARGCGPFRGQPAPQRLSTPLEAPAGISAAAVCSSGSNGSTPAAAAAAAAQRRQRWRRSAAEADAATLQPPGSGSKDVPQADNWELDFCSRPILDERGKKVWELIICDADRTFEYAQYFPNNKINSAEVRAVRRRQRRGSPRQGRASISIVVGCGGSGRGACWGSGAVCSRQCCPPRRCPAPAPAPGPAPYPPTPVRHCRLRHLRHLRSRSSSARWRRCWRCRGRASPPPCASSAARCRPSSAGR